MKEELIGQIISIEWSMFVNVSNIGGPASCQQDPDTFTIMRSSQFYPYPENALQSYLNDLDAAEMQGRNLMTEKYARMMEFTNPLEYKKIKDFLPCLPDASIEYTEKILPVLMDWEMEMAKTYPNLMYAGRPLHTYEDTCFATSVETYLRGELSTYSPQTLGFYYDFLLSCINNKIDPVEQTYICQVSQYGYNSLKEADESMKRSF